MKTEEEPPFELMERFFDELMTKFVQERQGGAPDLAQVRRDSIETMKQLGLSGGPIVPTAILAFRRTLVAETDRGSALALAAYLDAEIGSLLRRFMVDDSAAADELFEERGALAAFSARIDAAFAFGLIGRQVKRDLHLIRKIRNDFAHDPGPISFASPAVASRCRELTHGGDVPPGKDRIIRVMMGLLGVLHATRRSLRHRKVIPDVNQQRVRELMAKAEPLIQAKTRTKAEGRKKKVQAKS